MSISVGTNSQRSVQQNIDQSNRNGNQKKCADNSLISTVKDVAKDAASVAGHVIDTASRVGSLISTVV